MRSKIIMNNKESNPDTQADMQPHPGQVSQVELSFAALNLNEVVISESSLGRSAAKKLRKSHKDGEIKVRVKSFSSVSTPQPDISAQEQEEEDYEAENEIEKDYFAEEHQIDDNDKRSSKLIHDRPPLLPHLTDVEEGSHADYVPDTPPSTPSHTFDRESELALDDEMEDNVEAVENIEEGEEEQSSSEALDEQDEVKKENIHCSLLEKECVIPEVIVVWEYVCKFIIEKMMEGFAVKIPGVGTFSHSVLPSDVIKKPEAGKFSSRKTRKFPVFKICPHLKEMYKLSEENHSYHCNTPVIPLNISIVASNAKLTPGFVDGIIIETLQSFVTGIITNKLLEFPFPFIGKLFIKQRKVFMIFYQQFCEGLSFQFDYAPSYISSVFLGNMTPLAYHHPANEFHSVFHFCDVRSVEDEITAKPRPYAKGKMYREETLSGDPCEFTKNLYTHSNLLYDCSCCEEKDPSKAKEGDDDYESKLSTPCGFSKNYSRIRRACCTEQGSFVFQKPDGSTFSPEPLNKTSKTGNPILDRLSDDRCLFQQAIGCWMKKKVVQTLGTETIAKHYQREYFRRADRDNARKSFLMNESSPETITPSASSALRSSFNSTSTKSKEITAELYQEDLETFDDKKVEIPDGLVEDISSIVTNQRTAINAKNIKSRSFRTSKDAPAEILKVIEKESMEQSSPSHQYQGSKGMHPIDKYKLDEFEQNE